jgi:hypothetical protein
MDRVQKLRFNYPATPSRSLPVRLQVDVIVNCASHRRSPWTDLNELGRSAVAGRGPEFL